MSSGACRTAVVAAAVVTTAVVCSVCAAGMLMGGALGPAAGVATCGGDWGCVGRSGLAGAAGGALAPLGGAGLGGALLGGALSSAGSGAAGQFMAGRFDAGALRRDALVGAGTGAAFHALGGLRGSLRGRGGAEPEAARAVHAGDLVESPLWTATKTRTGPQNAYQHFADHGPDFPDIQNSLEYVVKAQNFLRTPPGGTLTRVRTNGDVVRWHRGSNTFGVMDSSGAPRTFFRPDPSVHGYDSNWDYFYSQ
jgi:hypothetical protein